jgi:hypothetical protein
LSAYPFAPLGQKLLDRLDFDVLIRGENLPRSWKTRGLQLVEPMSKPRRPFRSRFALTAADCWVGNGVDKTLSLDLQAIAFQHRNLDQWNRVPGNADDQLTSFLENDVLSPSCSKATDWPFVLTYRYAV